MTPNAEAALAALSHLEVDANPVSVKAKSRDFFWYSPVLKAALDHVTADFTVSPRSEEEVALVLRTCFAHDVPVTVRGAGTGNYGQAMPLAGGCVLHMNRMDRVKAIAPGRVVVEPGALLQDIDTACIAHSGQELRLFSSTRATATIGGFIAGGSGGVGGVRWGGLRDLGNIIRLRVLTMEAEPRVMEFTGEELHRVSHAYGTNGVITEVEMPLAPAYDWVGIIMAFPDFPGALRFGHDLASEDGILLKLATLYEPPIAQTFFQRVAPHVQPGQTTGTFMVAPHAMPAFETFVARYPGAQVIHRSDRPHWPRDPGHVYEFAWNHTTLRALKVDPAITYLQVGYGADDPIGLVERVRAAFSPEVLQHVEITRQHGRVAMGGLSLVKYTTEARLDEIIRQHEAMGAPIYNPHRYTLEEGGRQTVDAMQLAFKREADPKGLLNPGKMIAWDDPTWAYDRKYAWPGLRKAAE